MCGRRTRCHLMAAPAQTCERVSLRVRFRLPSSRIFAWPLSLLPLQLEGESMQGWRDDDAKACWEMVIYITHYVRCRNLLYSSRWSSSEISHTIESENEVQEVGKFISRVLYLLSEAFVSALLRKGYHSNSHPIHPKNSPFRSHLVSTRRMPYHQMTTLTSCPKSLWPNADSAPTPSSSRPPSPPSPSQAQPP